MKNVLVTDVTLRDGNHAISHQLDEQQIASYCRLANAANVPIIEVGHGNGLGASSRQVGESKTSDERMLKIARDNLHTSKLGVHVIPGFATIKRDIALAISCDVDVFRIASHCTEANITERHIAYCKDHGKTVFGVLMMTHMTSKEVLLEQSLKMQAYGADGIVIMDSAGAYLPVDVQERIQYLVTNLSISVGFHGHNNLGMAIANTTIAIQAGASMVDGSIRGFGAGAGNTQLEVLVPVCEKLGYTTHIDLYGILDAADFAERAILPTIPYISNTSIISGLSGVFSGFLKPVIKISKELNLDPRDIFFELGKRKVVAGQEDVIIEVAQHLKKIKNKNISH